MYNIYDFDKTIYKGDSSVDLYIYNLIRNPLIIKYLPTQVIGIIKYKLKKISKKEMKEKYFIFLKGIKDIDLKIEQFWNKKYKKIQKWYLDQNHDNDIIISASPEFLLLPLKETLKVKDIIATKVNKKSGKFESENCYGKEKVIRLKEKYPKIEVANVYSDSMSDLPILKLAKNSYLVNNNKILKINTI